MRGRGRLRHAPAAERPPVQGRGRLRHAPAAPAADRPPVQGRLRHPPEAGALPR